VNQYAQFLYDHSPIPLQNIAVNLYGLKMRTQRYGGSFEEKLNWLEETQWWSEVQIQEYQAQELRKLVHHAYHTVPYYRRIFDERGLVPENIQSPDDLHKLPLLTKEDIQKHRAELVSNSFRIKDMVEEHTSGTTGKSLHFYLPSSAVQFKWAVWWRHKKRFGIPFGVSHALFTGKIAVPLGQKRPPFWRENWSMNQTVFPMQHITPEKVEHIVMRLNRGKYSYYTGYPSIIYVLAELIDSLGYKITSPPEIIFTGAETLYETQRQLISKVFQAPVTDQYGFTEGCGNASRCGHDNFHEDFEFGILECVDAEKISETEKRGRIVATGFSNYGMPFIRYDVGDTAIWRDKQCECRRQSAVIKWIEGRVEDFVVTPENRKICRFDYIFKDTSGIKEAQIVQKERGSIVIRIIPRGNYSTATEEILEEEIRARISSSLVVNFEYVENIPRSESGKFQAVISEIGP